MKFTCSCLHFTVCSTGGLRYHGMAPLISHVYELGYMEAIAIPQIECFEGNLTFHSVGAKCGTMNICNGVCVLVKR